MSYLVDGNNVMGQRAGWHRDKPGARRRLLSELARFSKGEGARVEVVFDGAPDEHFPDGSYFMGVRVFYAARGSDADSTIKRMVDASRERRTLVVVTSDRELASYVRASGVRVVRSGEFRKRLDASAEASARRVGREDAPEMSREELLREMRYFGVTPEDDDEES
ncbi:MAG TPA: NYN domain-containing protein [Pyrinomonadaceae bacterium]|nr:NYN domain-containing protein [Pyrinomonadaceae bacterium]